MKIAKQILYPAFRFLARRRQARAAAWLLHMSSQTVRRHVSPSNGRPYRVLALSVNKPGFLEDIEETFLVDGTFELVLWPFYALKAFADALLAPSLNNKRYVTDDPSVEATKQDYRAFLADVWKHFCAINPVHVVASPNYGYYVQREFAAALEEAGTPFIVLHKENLKSSGRVEYWKSVYQAWRGKFSGRKILVYNDIERTLQVESGVADPDKIVITGMPRLDRVHKWRLNQASQSSRPQRLQVLFFAFDKKDKLPTSRTKRPDAQIDNRWGELSWGDLCEKTHQAVAELANRRPDISVVVKTKTASRHQTDVIRMLEGNLRALPNNLKLVSGGDAFQSLTESHVVIGFNTTAQLEALAAGIPVIVPWFSEAIDPKTSEFVIDLGDAVEYARSPEQIIDLVCKHLDNHRNVASALSLTARHALIKWTGNDDGQARRRALEAVYMELNRSEGAPSASV